MWLIPSHEVMDIGGGATCMDVSLLLNFFFCAPFSCFWSYAFGYLCFFFSTVFPAPRAHPRLRKNVYILDYKTWVIQFLHRHHLKSLLLEVFLLFSPALLHVVLLGPLHLPFPLLVPFTLLAHPLVHLPAQIVLCFQPSVGIGQKWE